MYLMHMHPGATRHKVIVAQHIESYDALFRLSAPQYIPLTSFSTHSTDRKKLAVRPQANCRILNPEGREF